LVVNAAAAVDPCGGRGGKVVPDSSDQTLGLVLEVPGLRSREEAVVRTLAARLVRMTSQAWIELCLRRIAS